MMQDHRGRDIAAFIDVRHQADKLLGVPSCVGLALVEGFYTGDPWLSPQQAAHRANVSDETARRRLNDLVNIGRAKSITGRGPGKLYRIDREVAAKVKGYIDHAAFSTGRTDVAPAFDLSL